MKGPGAHDVDLISIEIYDAHDAVELAGPATSVGTLDLQDCYFHDVENGLELAGEGVRSFSVVSSTFTRCANLPGGLVATPASTTGAIAVRGTAAIDAFVRDCTFANNGYSVRWFPDRSDGVPAYVDLGTDCDPGGNVFMPFDFDPLDPTDNVYRVHVYHDVDVHPADELIRRIDAAGNTWIPGQQGADAVTGALTGVQLGPSTNTPNAGGLVPPGPFQDSSWDRNFSIRYQYGRIDFGDGQCP